MPTVFLLKKVDFSVTICYAVQGGEHMIYDFDDLSFRLLTIDRFRHKEGFFFVKDRPYAALSFRLSGYGKFSIAGRQLQSCPGDVLFIPAGMPYEVEYSASESIVIHLTDCNYSEPESCPAVNRSAVESHFLQLLDDWNNQRSVQRAKARIFGILALLADERTVSAADTCLTECLRYLETHLSDTDLDVDTLCRYVFVSRSGLQRAFRSGTGLSPKQYLLRLRMNRALDLLTGGRLSVKDVAQNCGFSDEKYFSRLFKKTYGCAPSQLRRQISL